MLYGAHGNDHCHSQSVSSRRRRRAAPAAKEDRLATRMTYLTIYLLALSLTSIKSQLYNPYYNIFRQNDPYYGGDLGYANQFYQPLPHFLNKNDGFLQDNILESYLSTPDLMPTLNVLAEIPYSVANRFTVVPMLAVTKDNMQTVSNAHVLQVSKEKPTMTVKNAEDDLLQCTPAVKITLEQPFSLYSLKTNIVFPSEVEISHGRLKIPIKVGAIIAPIRGDVFVSPESPISVSVVYAVPTKPFNVFHEENRDEVDVPDTQAVVVDSNTRLPHQPPKNVTVLNFPEKEAEPSLHVDEEDDELVNRNPPQVLAPAGIVQSTQPQSSVQEFHNSKEHPILTSLREQDKRM